MGQVKTILISVLIGTAATVMGLYIWNKYQVMQYAKATAPAAE
jgi:hypothetical protein